MLMFHPLNRNHDTKEAVMCHSVPVSLCARFNPLQYLIRYRNATGSKPDVSIDLDDELLVSNMLFTRKAI
jgi:hypothetical protein